MATIRELFHQPEGRAPTGTTPRERLNELLDALTDDQVETVLKFAEAMSRGRAVVSVCDGSDANSAPPPWLGGAPTGRADSQ